MNSCCRVSLHVTESEGALLHVDSGDAAALSVCDGVDTSSDTVDAAQCLVLEYVNSNDIRGNIHVSW